MKQFIKDFFSYNKRERRGIFILVLIIIFLLVFLYYSAFWDKAANSDFSQFEEEIEKMITLPDSQNADQASRWPKIDNDFLSERFDFNPNHLSQNEWKRLGLSDKQVNAIKNFEASGGKFRQKEDLKKIYVISEEFYKSVEPFIKIPEDTSEKNFFGTPYNKKEKKTLEIEINSADTNLFKKLKGIGSGYAARIIKYRNALGGFTELNQIMEVYGFPPQLFDTISKYLTIDTAGLKKINVNTSTVEELKKHPYVNWNVANAIVAYRENHGPYQHVFDIRKTDLVDDDLYRKIAPYLITK